MLTKRTLLLGGLAGGLLALGLPAHAQGRYPDRPIKLIIPFSAGGQFDIVARMLAQFASTELQQPVVVENVAGSGGNIGAARVANAAPDGYTLLVLGGNHAIAKSLYAKPGYDVTKDFSPISMVSITPHVVLVNAAMPIHSMAELVAYAKKNPGKLNYATPGMGTSMHLTFEMIKAHYGVDITHIPYRGGANALTDLSGGQVNLGIIGIAPAQEFLNAGRIRALARCGAGLPGQPGQPAADGGNGVPDRTHHRRTVPEVHRVRSRGLRQDRARQQDHRRLRRHSDGAVRLQQLDQALGQRREISGLAHRDADRAGPHRLRQGQGPEAGPLGP
jgi:tripartite-type tricarboxylate transporter receptor subunit TctC